MEQFLVNELTQGLGLAFCIYNRGFGGFVIDQLLDALEPCVLALEPKYLFLNIGTNDMNSRDYQLERLLEKYETLIARVRARLPETEIFLLAYYPVNPGVAAAPYLKEIFRHRTNAVIRAANRGVQCLAQKTGCRYLDLNDSITDENGELKAAYTVEGMHMYADGYEAVLKALLPTLKTLS